MSDVEARNELTVIQRRKLGLTFGNVLRTARQLSREGLLITDDPQEAAAQVAAAMAADSPTLFKSVADEDGRDWEAFFAALISFLEKLMPLILQLISIFGV